MAILHINTNRGWGGGENQVLALLSGMAAKGARAILYADRRGTLLGRARLAGLEARPVPVSTAPWLAFLAGRLIVPCAKRDGTTLVHVHDSGSLNLGSVVSRRLGVPLILSRRVASRLRMNPWSRRKYSPERLAMVIAISETVRDVMVSCGFPADRIRVVPSGVDIDGLAALEPETSFRSAAPASFWVGGIGRLSWKKNWAFLIRTAARLAAEGVDVRWIIVGDGPDMKRLRKMAEKAGVADRTYFTGFRPDATRILKGLDALFFPSRMEGASVTVREAMAMGVPVIAADAPGVVESLAGHGWIVRCDDVEAAAAAVRDAMSNPAKRVQVAEAARRSAMQRFPISATIDGTLEAYREVLAMWGRADHGGERRTVGDV